LIGKSEAGKIQAQFAIIDIAHFFEQTAREIEENAKTHSIDIHSTCTVHEFSLDEKLLRNITINLLTNAIKFSPTSNVVFLRISNSPNHLKIEVEDLGIGITDEDLKNMFTSFYRGNNVGSIPGTGLGLSIVKKAVDLLHGDINIKSKAGSGTIITVTLPI
jgi:signal transduction histidine kinase